VPFEFLHTAETDSPQVMISVEGMPAVCHSLKCGYKYVAPIASISSFTHSGTTLTINGVNLPSKVNSILFSHVPCENIQYVSSSQLTCTVTPVAGNGWYPVVTDDKGLIPVDPAATLKNIPVTVSAVSPNSNLNPWGGTIVTITGTGMPQNINKEDSYSVTFSGGNKCSVISVAATQIRCIPEKFPATGSVSLTVTVNAVSSTAVPLTVRTEATKVTQISPNSASPVIKGNMTLTVSGFP